MIFGCCIKNPSDILAVKTAGYDYFEFSGTVLANMSEEDFERLCRLSRLYSLPCPGLNSYSAGEPAIVGDNCSFEKTEEYARLICERALLLGAKNIGIGAPKARKLPEGYSKELADSQCEEFLNVTAAVAKAYGMNVLIEAVNSRACDYMTYTREAVAMVERFAADNIFIVADFYHMEVMGESFDEVLTVGDRLMHTHISTCGENYSRSFPQMDEKEKYEGIAKLLRSMNYNGSMSIEPGAFDPELAAGCLKMLKSVF